MTDAFKRFRRVGWGHPSRDIFPCKHFLNSDQVCEFNEKGISKMYKTVSRSKMYYVMSSHRRLSGVFTVNLEHILHLILMFLLLSLSW